VYSDNESFFKSSSFLFSMRVKTLCTVLALAIGCTTAPRRQYERGYLVEFGNTIMTEKQNATINYFRGYPIVLKDGEVYMEGNLVGKVGKYVQVTQKKEAPNEFLIGSMDREKTVTRYRFRLRQNPVQDHNP